MTFCNIRKPWDDNLAWLIIFWIYVRVHTRRQLGWVLRVIVDFGERPFLLGIVNIGFQIAKIVPDAPVCGPTLLKVEGQQGTEPPRV